MLLVELAELLRLFHDLSQIRDSCGNSAEPGKTACVNCAITSASVVFPLPGGPQKIIDVMRSPSILRRSNLPGPSRCSCPRSHPAYVGASVPRVAPALRCYSRSMPVEMEPLLPFSWKVGEHHLGRRGKIDWSYAHSFFQFNLQNMHARLFLNTANAHIIKIIRADRDRFPTNAASRPEVRPVWLLSPLAEPLSLHAMTPFPLDGHSSLQASNAFDQHDQRGAG